MAAIVNLRQKRKEAARKAARLQADANAAKFGQSKSDKALAKARTEAEARKFDGHRRERD